MEQIVSLCKRRGFVYPASEIYGGLRGFLGLRPARRPAQEQHPRPLVAGHGRVPPDRPRRAPGRDRRPRLGHHPAPDGVEGVGPRRQLQRPHGRRPRDQGAVPGGPRQGVRPQGRHRQQLRLRRRPRRGRAEDQAGRQAERRRLRRGRPHDAATGGVRPGRRPRHQGRRDADRAAGVQPDVGHLPRPHPRGGQQGLPPPRDGPGHLPRLQERRRHHPRQGAVRRGPGGQELSQ